MAPWLVLIASTLVSSLHVVEDALALEQYRLKHTPSDYILLRSGDKCTRCDAIEHTMKSLNRHVEIPVVIAKYEQNQDPILEYHRLEEAEGGYREEPYSGQMTLGSILKFVEKKVRRRANFKEAKTIEQAVTESHSKGRVPLVVTIPSHDSAGMAAYEEAHKILSKDPLLKNVDYWYLVDPEFPNTMGQITVTHPQEMRLAAAIPSVAFIVDWVRKESVPQFGKLTKESVLRLQPDDGDMGWMLLLGNGHTYDLFQHEFRLFAMYNRDEWKAGFIDLDGVGAEALVKKVLNIEEEVKSLLASECVSECVVLRKRSLIRFFSTENLSEDRLQQLSLEMLKPERNVRLPETMAADLAAENDALKKNLIHSVTKRDFQQRVVLSSDPVLILLHEPQDILSQELKSVFVSVANSLQMKGIKFYEMDDLPPPDERYETKTLPHLWFKPLGQNSPPVSIPWYDHEAPPAPPSAPPTVASLWRTMTKSALLKVRGAVDIALEFLAGESAAEL